jgi:A/G-specific adenine glycosylase
MLQQTTVTAAIPYYQRFVRRFPTLQALAAAPMEGVMAAWAGLGYYARARHLHSCARIRARDGIPHVSAELRRLPGIGHYTATAIAAIAFNQPGVPVDGNVERVVARAFAITQPLPGAKPVIHAAAIRLGEAPEAQARPSDFAQALFDLGATICTSAEPSCFLCPWANSCAGLQAGMPSALPYKAPPRRRPVRYGVHFWLADGVGNVLLRRRPAEGLLGGMMELPGTTWRAEPWDENAFSSAPMPAIWRIAGEVRHGFTHFELRLRVMAAQVAEIHAEGSTVPIETLAEQALPSVMRKCVALCVPQAASASTSRRRGTTRTGIAA